MSVSRDSEGMFCEAGNKGDPFSNQTFDMVDLNDVLVTNRLEGRTISGEWDVANRVAGNVFNILAPLHSPKPFVAHKHHLPPTSNAQCPMLIAQRPTVLWPTDTIASIFESLVPENIFDACVTPDILSVITFAIFFGCMVAKIDLKGGESRTYNNSVVAIAA